MSDDVAKLLGQLLAEQRRANEIAEKALAQGSTVSVQHIAEDYPDLKRLRSFRLVKDDGVARY